MCEPSFRKIGQDVLEFLTRNWFGTFDPSDLDLCHVTQKTIGSICYPGLTDMCKAICPLFFEGGHKNSKEAKQVPLPDKVKHDCINYSVGQSVFLI